MEQQKLNLPSSVSDKLTSLCREFSVDESLARALILASSGGNMNFCCFSKHSQKTNLSLPRPTLCDVDTEFVFQRTRWGLFGIYGFIARRLQFEGWLTSLLYPFQNIEIGVKHIFKLSLTYSGDELISAYNYGHPRYVGTDITNNDFVQKTRSYM